MLHTATSGTMPKRVLITGAGGAAAIAFHKAVQHLSQFEIHMGDMSAYSSGLYLVPEERRWLLPAGKDPDYAKRLLQLCQHAQIEIIVPTVDVELVPLAEARSQFSQAGIYLACADSACLRTCTDKLSLMQALDGSEAVSFFCTWDSQQSIDALAFPLIAKPRRGSGGNGVQLISAPQQLKQIPQDGSYLLQTWLPGAEYSVDVYASADQVVASVVRERLKVDSGIAVICSTRHDESLSQMASTIAQRLRIRHAANIQFKRDVMGKPRLLEINPRFPGTMSLTVAAGVNMPELCLREAVGEKLAEHYPYQEISMVRTWQEHFVAVDTYDRLANSQQAACA